MRSYLLHHLRRCTGRDEGVKSPKDNLQDLIHLTGKPFPYKGVFSPVSITVPQSYDLISLNLDLYFYCMKLNAEESSHGEYIINVINSNSFEKCASFANQASKEQFYLFVSFYKSHDVRIVLIVTIHKTSH